MTSKQRAEKVTTLLKRAWDLQMEAKYNNGHHCFSLKSLTILSELSAQIDKAFAEVKKETK